MAVGVLFTNSGRAALQPLHEVDDESKSVRASRAQSAEDIAGTSTVHRVNCRAQQSLLITITTSPTVTRYS